MIPSRACFDLTRRFEGCKSTAYPDPGTGGAPWTIGYGHTFGVHEGMTAAQDQIDMWLAQDMSDASEIVDTWVKTKLTQPQFDALCDFVFNVGRGMPEQRDGFVWLRNGQHSTILKLLNEGRYLDAAQEFPKWNLPPLRGIKLRRQAEMELFLSGTVTAPPTEAT